MNPERWQQIEALYRAARERKPEERNAFLEGAAGDDADLRRQVEALLRQDSVGPTQDPGAQTVATQTLAIQTQSTQTIVGAGSQLGPYKIEAPIGAGGMGEVFRATDTRLHRTVAIKILPSDKVADPDRKKRFLQEARAASALNHPNIVTMHDIASDAGMDYLVMEFVPGRPLDKVITHKGLPLAEAVGYTMQISSALAAAHAAGIVHRDMKPANVIVTAEGQVKILDFGLAKLTERAPLPEGETLTQEAALTEAGTVMGTVAYMSPEQASAKPLDHRTDIFSLGVMLYEMLAGKRPFRGKSQVETMHAIINEPAPPLTQPPELQEITDKALAKDPKDRYQHAGDFGLDLRRFQQRPLAARLASAGNKPAQRLAWIAAAVLLLAMPVVWWAGRRAASMSDTVLSSEVSITPFTTNLGYNGEATISPDDQTIAYVSDRTGRFDIFLRQIGSNSDIALTRDQGDNIQPAFSPDGRQIAFVTSRAGGAGIFYPGFDNPMMGGDIWIMPALGGTPRRVAKDGNFPSWSRDGSKIVFARYRIGLFEVAASGGGAHEIKLPNAPRQIYYPAYSSDSRWVFFEDSANGVSAVPSAGGAVQQIATGRHPVWDEASQTVIYSDSREGNNHSLWSVPFSVQDGKPSGRPRALTVGRGRDWQPAVSRDGKLVAYTAIQTSFNLEAAPFDAEGGHVLGLPRVLTTGNQVSYFMRFSPDGRSVAFESSRGAGRHIWRVDIGSEPVQLTSDPKFEETFPQWSPDGNTIAFTRQPAQSPNSKSLWLMNTDGANPRQILEGNNLTRWLPDGSGIVYQNLKNQVLLYELGSGRSRQISTQPDIATMLTPSLDGKWIVYQSTGKDAANVDAHAVRLDGGEPRVVASTPRQDYHPFFSPTGRWVYFQPDHKNLYRVPGPAQDWKPADPVKITDFSESGLFLEDPQISRDGKQLLYSRGKITGDIWVLRRGK
jgi:eukaryotic-like serine/threonine-protein kinase